MGDFTGIYRGKVLSTDVDALDELQLGRIKVEVYPMLVCNDEDVGSASRLIATGANIEGIPLASIPWATPAMSLFAGAGAGTGCFVVPDVGSFVWVFFEGGDHHQPVYFAEAVDQVHGLPTEIATGYPFTKVWKSKSGIVVTINDTEDEQEIKVVHPTGSLVQIDKNGNINVTAIKDIAVTSTEDINVTATGNVIIQGAIVSINPTS